MHSTQERVQAVQKSIKTLKKRRAQRRYRATVIASGGLSLFMVVLIAHIIPNALEGQIEGSYGLEGLSASVFVSSTQLGYLVIGITSFLLGVAVTLLCVTLAKKRRDDEC